MRVINAIRTTTYLNDALHQVLLSQGVPAVYNLLQHSWKNNLQKETIKKGGGGTTALRIHVSNPSGILVSCSQATETHLFVLFHIDTFQLAEPNEVSAHQNPQLLSFLLSLLSVSTVALMLHPHPQFVHFSEVQEHKVHGVIDITCQFL